MDFLKIIGESKLQGSIGISGAKNSALPLIALSTLAKNEITLENLPEVVDIKTFLSLLSMLGCGIQEIDNHTKTIITSTLNNTKANYDIVRKNNLFHNINSTFKIILKFQIIKKPYFNVV